MSATPDLTAHQLFQSHVVSCSKCHGYYQKKEVNDKKKPTKYSLCPVGLVLFARAKAENPNENPFRPQSFPFVAKLYERVLALVNNVWQEARVMDRSIGAAKAYEKLNEETGLMEWRTSTQRVIGYEVQTPHGKYYVNEYNIKKLQSSLPPEIKSRVTIKHG